MKLTINDVLKFIVLSLLVLTALCGANFAQQPAPPPTPTPAPDVPANTRVAASERGVSSEVSERERILIERIERLERKLNEYEGLERRLNELESRLGSTALNAVAGAA